MASIQAFYKFASTAGIPGADAVKLRLTTNYSAIATDLGLVAASATDPGQPISSSEAMIRRMGSKIRITVKEGTNKTSSHHIFCAQDQEDAAIKSLTGKNSGAKPIVSVGYPMRAKWH